MHGLTCIFWANLTPFSLKGLLEDGEILLADGRRFVSSKSPLFASAEPPGSSDSASPLLMLTESRVCQIHQRFRVFALANRPGYPFLGNDFFAEMGDVFACHAVDNPDQASEISLLHSYAPTIPLDTLTRLTSAFMELRGLMDDGLINYPYSTRELVNIVRHMSEYPEDSLGKVVSNVFSFDSWDVRLIATVTEAFGNNGLDIGEDSLETESRHPLVADELTKLL
jgi:hypothetical protein